MRINHYTFDYKPVLFIGYVYYEDMTPVKNAIVLLEMVLYDSERACKNTNIKPSCTYTKTNKCGEFCFEIVDSTHYYTVKIFDNKDFN